MSGQQMTIRPGVPDDAEAGAHCHVACWREAYGGLVDRDLLAQRTSDLGHRIGRWRAILAQDPVRWLAVLPSGEVVGFSHAGPPRDDDPVRPLELYAIYVRAAQYGTGLSDQLLAAAVSDLPAYLWVLDGNARAIRFYQRHGFESDGARKPEPTLEATDRRMRRPMGRHAAVDPG